MRSIVHLMNNEALQQRTIRYRYLQPWQLISHWPVHPSPHPPDSGNKRTSSATARHPDVIKNYLAMVCLGTNDFETINIIESQFYFMTARDIDNIPSEATLRQRMDNHAEAFLSIVENATRDFLVNAQSMLAPLYTGYVSINADSYRWTTAAAIKKVFLGHAKERTVTRPYQPIWDKKDTVWPLEMREGKQHCQNGTSALLERSLQYARKVTDQPLLLWLGGSNDSIESIDVVLEYNDTSPYSAPIDFLTKWNPRWEGKDEWFRHAEVHGDWTYLREDQRVAPFNVDHKRRWQCYEYSVRRVMRVIERTIDKEGQLLLTLEIELEGRWTSLSLGEEVIKLYADHGTSEQFHSEFKTDLDLERIPSSKLATNVLVLAISILAYNLAVDRPKRFGSGLSQA